MSDVLQMREVTGFFTARIPDSGDADLNPDTVPLTGNVTFHPEYRKPLVFPGEHIVLEPINAIIIDGQLMVEVIQNEDVVLQALHLPVTMDEHANQTWSWTMRFHGMTLGQYGETVELPDVRFVIEEGNGPLDLSTVPQTTARASSNFITRGAPGAGLQDITAVNGEIVFSWDNGNTAVVPVPDAVEGPPGPMVDVTAGTVEVGATPTDFGVSVTGEGETRQINVTLPKPEKGDDGDPGQDGEGATDPEMAARISNPATQTRAALDESFIGSESVRRIVTTDDLTYQPGSGEAVFYTRPPKTFFTDFSTDTVGQTPTGWTPRWLPTRTWLVQSATWATGGQAVTATGSGHPGGLESRTITSMAQTSSIIEMVWKTREESGNGAVRAALRCSGGVSDETGYWAGKINGTEIGGGKYLDGTTTKMDGPHDFTTTVGADYINLVRMAGIYIYVKRWLDSDPEPTEWQWVGHDELITDGDWWGLMAANGNTQHVDWVGVAVGGQAAPRSA